MAGTSSRGEGAAPREEERGCTKEGGGGGVGVAAAKGEKGWEAPRGRRGGAARVWG